MKIIHIENATGINALKHDVYRCLLHEISGQALYGPGPIGDINDTLYNQLFANLESTLTINSQDKWL